MVDKLQERQDGKPPLINEKLLYLPLLPLAGGTLTAIELVKHGQLLEGVLVIAGTAIVSLVVLVVCLLISRWSSQ